MSEDELRALSRNTTEDRNLATVAHSADSVLDATEVRGSRGKDKQSASTSSHAAHGSKHSIHNQSLTATLTAPLKNPLDETDFTGFGKEEYADYDVEYEEGEDEDEYSRPGTAGSSDFNLDGSLRRKPYQNALSKPVIKAGRTTITAAQARLFGLTDFKGASKEVDPDANAKQQLKRIHNLTHVKPKDLSYIRSDDDIESTFKPARSAEAQNAMRNPACGYDFVDRLAAQENGFLERAAAGAQKGGKSSKVVKDQAEADYIASNDKLGCPQCKALQSFEEMWDKKRKCNVCDLRFVKINVSSGAGFERRMKMAEEKRQENIKKAADEMYGFKPFKPHRPKDHYLDLKADMQDLFLALFEPFQEGTTYLRDTDQSLSAIAKTMQKSPNFLVLPKKTQREMTSAAITGFLEMDGLFSKYVRYDAASKRKVLTDWRESPDYSIPITGMTTITGDAGGVLWSGDQSAPPDEDEARRLKELRLKRAQGRESESKSKAEGDKKRGVKPAQYLELPPADENKGSSNRKHGGQVQEDSKEAVDQVHLLKQLAKLNAEKANLLNATLAAAEQRTKENKEFIAATQASKVVGNSDDARARSTSGNGSGVTASQAKSQAKSRSSAESKKKAGKDREAKSFSKTAAAGVDKFDALLNF